MAKASIIIPVYNVHNYVQKTIESAIKQSESDIDIILVDDGSTDGSGELCDSFAKTDKRIKVIHKENGGLSSARNCGVNIASSEYVMFLDGDDYLNKNAVSTVLQAAEKYKSDIIQFRYTEVQKDKAPQETATGQEIFQASSPRELFENLYKTGGEYASGCTKLYKKDLLLRIPFIDIQHEDEMWCTQAFTQPLTVTYIPDSLYYYVMRENSIVHTSFNRRKLDIFQVIQKRIEALQKLQLNDLLRFEYTRLFTAIVMLYCDAKKSGDKEALSTIKRQFADNKESIKKYGEIKGKLLLVFKMMCMNYHLIWFYGFYSNLRKH
ncbi:MAG: glycosyltransferase family 2 protein [Candidatus Avispirillum sp.]